MSYFDFVDKIKKDNVKVIFELGSRDLVDSFKLVTYYDESTLYAFECNPDCLDECHKNYNNVNDSIKNRVFLIENAVSLVDGGVTFYPFDLSKYDNKGASSMLQIDFSQRDKSDPDYNRGNVQKEITVKGMRIDTFMKQNNIDNIDLLCMDLQGYELNALKSIGDSLHTIKYIITECSLKSTYLNGCSFNDLNNYLKDFGFVFVTSNRFGSNIPTTNSSGFVEFDSIFIHKSVLET